MDSAQPNFDDNYDIAIIGMDGRFPGARSPEDFWQNLKNGVETISFFSDDELDLVSAVTRSSMCPTSTR